jgi:hypothetical protein
MNLSNARNESPGHPSISDLSMANFMTPVALFRVHCPEEVRSLGAGHVIENQRQLIGLGKLETIGEWVAVNLEMGVNKAVVTAINVRVHDVVTTFKHDRASLNNTNLFKLG